MTAEEILNKYCDDTEDIYVLRSSAIKAIEEATKEMYPEAFVRWAIQYIEYFPYGDTYFGKDIALHFVGLPLLFEYWKQNIQGK